jgi:hypothetical protein
MGEIGVGVRFVAFRATWRGLAQACGLGALLAMVVSPPAFAKPNAITGELSKSGYTVVALAASGEGDTALAKPRFKLHPTDERVSLHLQGRDGFYAGPVVLGTERKGKAAIVGARSGAKLGEVSVHSRKGYGKVQGVGEEDLDPKRQARAKRGVPIGAGNFGVVRSKPPRKAPPGDLDADGVADPLDIDDNGNLVIDQYEGTEVGPAARAKGDLVLRQGQPMTVYARVVAVNQDGSVVTEDCRAQFTVTTRWPQGSPNPEVGKAYKATIELQGGQINVLSVTGPLKGGCPESLLVPDVAAALSLTLKDTLNAHAHVGDPGEFEALVEQTLSNRGILVLFGGSGEKGTVELDCYGAPFCTANGTGRFVTDFLTYTSPRSWPPFPECCTGPHGFGEITSGGGFLSHGATTDQIGAGTGLNFLITTPDGELHPFPTSLAGVFATVPALTSYEDGAGNSRPITYPAPPPYEGSPRDFFGPFEGPYVGLPVAPCPANGPPPCVDEGDAVAKLTFFRPQREAIGDEPGPWTDIRGLVYTVSLATGFPVPNTCKQDYLAESDPNLTAAPSPGIGIFAGGGFLDEGDDADDTVSFSVNMTKCLAAQGQDPRADVTVWLAAGARGAHGSAGATQQLLFTPQ